MIYDIRYSQEALEDLDNVWDDVFNASLDIDTADKYVTGILQSIKEKEKIPKTGIPLRFAGEFTGIYFVVYKKHNVFYRIADSQIEVARILYGASDYMKELFGKSEYEPDDEK